MKDSISMRNMNYRSTFFILSSFFATIGYITQVLLSGWLSLPFALIEIAFVSGVFTLFIRIFSRRGYTFSSHFLRYFLLLSSFIGLLSFIMWIGAFLSNTFPGALSKITLTNGENTIVYYQMSHIGTKKYYDSIRDELLGYAGNEYSIYLEGVLPGTPENQVRLEKALGIKISSGTYEDIAQVMGMQSQDERLLEGIDKKVFIHADLGVDDIVAYLSTGSVRTEDPVDMSVEFKSLRDASNNAWAISYIFRSLLNASIRYSLSTDGMFEFLGPETMQALLEKRNQKVIDTYYKNDTKKSVFLYGALHFEGIYALLKSKDPRWSIVSHDPIYPYVP